MHLGSLPHSSQRLFAPYVHSYSFVPFSIRRACGDTINPSVHFHVISIDQFATHESPISRPRDFEKVDCIKDRTTDVRLKKKKKERKKKQQRRYRSKFKERVRNATVSTCSIVICYVGIGRADGTCTQTTEELDRPIYRVSLVSPSPPECSRNEKKKNRRNIASSFGQLVGSFVRGIRD